MIAPMAQLDRVTDYESVGRVFESPWAHQFCEVRELTENIAKTRKYENLNVTAFFA